MDAVLSLTSCGLALVFSCACKRVNQRSLQVVCNWAAPALPKPLPSWLCRCRATVPTDPHACFLDFCSSARASDLCFQLGEEVRQGREESKFGFVLVASKQAVSEQSHCGRVPRRRPGMANALGPEPLPRECRLCLTARRPCAKRPRVRKCLVAWKEASRGRAC